VGTHTAPLASTSSAQEVATKRKPVKLHKDLTGFLLQQLTTVNFPPYQGGRLDYSNVVMIGIPL
jgi:hypothetical protein